LQALHAKDAELQEIFLQYSLRFVFKKKLKSLLVFSSEQKFQAKLFDCADAEVRKKEESSHHSLLCNRAAQKSNNLQGLRFCEDCQRIFVLYDFRGRTKQSTKT